ncbi:hypothetical protein Tco_1212464 [Tanacetum coccineum]
MVETEEIDPKTGKPKKNKGQSSSEELKLSDYDPLYLHSSDSNGNPLISFKLEGTENYKWRQYDSLVALPKCSCDTADKLKSHNQLIRLMQFLMGLDDVYASVRSNILITDPIPDVQSAFATLSRDESHRNSTVHNVKTSSTAFVARSNNDWTGNRNNQNKRFNQNRGPNTSLVCKNCNMTGHIVDRCFELIGYPPGFKRNPKVNNPKSSVNNASTSNSSGNTHVLTNDEYKKLMNLLRSSGLGSACDIQGNVAVPGYHVSLLSVHKLASANKVSVVFNESDCLIQDSTLKSLMRTGSMIGGLYYLDQGYPLLSFLVEVLMS